jgi:cytochrome c-type biogenesis protein CcmH/NrfF
MRKYFFNTAVLGLLFGGVSAARQTIKGPRNWRTILLWVGWGISVAIAVGEIQEQAREAREQAELDEYSDY